MLLELNIENFILIEKLNINFTNGLNVMSGETGAGKSIIIDAINLALGGKSNRDYIRTGKNKAVIQAVFDIEQLDINKALVDYGIDCDENLLILTREIYSNGRSISRINGRVVQLSIVKKISNMLLDIHGQHEHQSLLYSENHLDMLDLFGYEIVYDTRKAVENKYKELKDIENKLKCFNTDDKERERKIDLLKFQIDEIAACRIKKNEDIELTNQYELLKNSEKICSIINKAHETLAVSMEDEFSISSLLSNILAELNKISYLDSKIESFCNEIQDIYYRLQDIVTDIRHYKENMTFDSEQLLQIERRLDTINNLKRKYGNTIEEIIEYKEKLSIELEELIGSEERIKELNNKLEKCKKEYLELSKTLSLHRKKVAKNFEEKMVGELKYLNLDKSQFKVNIVPNLDKNNELIFTKDGIDRIEFLISTNPGEPLKSLSKVASGGEISRIMLAMKVILAKIDNIPTLIFDEIDSGISGKTANIVAEKLALVSNTHQTICITHLPQIAVMADNHLFIEKITDKDKTVTKIIKLNNQERIREISRLIGGNIITDLTVKNAKEMIEMAKNIKQNLKFDNNK